MGCVCVCVVFLVSILSGEDVGGKMNSGGSVKWGDGAGRIDGRCVCCPWTPNCLLRFQIAL